MKRKLDRYVSKSKRMYVDGVELTRLVNDYAERRDQARAAGQPLPPIPDKIAEAVIKIANEFMRSGRWANVPHNMRDDMISEGIALALNMITTTYDPNRLGTDASAFHAITSAIRFGFIGTIAKSMNAKRAHEEMVRSVAVGHAPGMTSEGIVDPALQAAITFNERREFESRQDDGFDYISKHKRLKASKRKQQPKQQTPQAPVVKKLEI